MRITRGAWHRRGLLAIAALVILPACATLDEGPRAARGSADCARAAVRAAVSPAMDDKRAHCVGAASIARRCSVFETHLAMYGKEVADALGRGDAEARDLAAGRHGIRCAREHAADIAACCASGGF